MIELEWELGEEPGPQAGQKSLCAPACRQETTRLTPIKPASSLVVLTSQRPSGLMTFSLNVAALQQERPGRDNGYTHNMHIA